MGPDFRVLVTRARKSAQAYWKIHGEFPPTKVLTQEIANVMQQATHSGYAMKISLLYFVSRESMLKRYPTVRSIATCRRLGY
jgi:20S proteasome alpha/beta subunit